MSWKWLLFLSLVLFVCVVLIIWNILNSIGIFNKERPCMHCGTIVKGTKLIRLGMENPEQDALCENCFNKIHHRLRGYAKKFWKYSDFSNYLVWEENTREERSQFHPMVEYGVSEKIKIDVDKGLFTIGSKKNELVFRFVDVVDADIDFVPETIKDKMLGLKVEGYEFVSVRMQIPFVYIEERLNTASYAAREKGFLNKHCEYDISDEFAKIMRIFSTCVYIGINYRENEENDYSSSNYSDSDVSINEIEKALALFMFDSMEDVTEGNLRKQRNALIKAFHPDNREENEVYAQKINAAYELLHGLL